MHWPRAHIPLAYAHQQSVALPVGISMMVQLACLALSQGCMSANAFVYTYGCSISGPVSLI